MRRSAFRAAAAAAGVELHPPMGGGAACITCSAGSTGPAAGEASQASSRGGRVPVPALIVVAVLALVGVFLLLQQFVL